MNKFKKIMTEYFFIASGSAILAFATMFFLVPFKISTGGVGGVATVLYHVGAIPLSVTTLILNFALFFFGYKTLKKTAIAKTVGGIIFYSLFLEVAEHFGVYSEDIMIASIFGGVLVGLGVGLTVRYDGSTGGSDFAALILNKLFPYISVVNFILLIDMTIIIVSGFIFESYTTMFYSAISLYISSKVTDYILIRGNFAKSVYIITKQSKEIANEIIKDMERGVTGIYSRGLYNQKDGMMLMCVVRPKEIPTLLDKVKNIDKDAFTVISDVREVCGEGFKEID